jgi:hypothetical protein
MRCVGWLAAILLSCTALLHPRPVARAQEHSRATLRLSFVPTDRAQIAVWVEKADGSFVGTLALTHATATLGIGNRPGALQMNSGFRWPYGRREGVLPVWAHRRAAAPEARQFKRVIFQDRVEGLASRTANDMSPDDYYCLSFSKPDPDAPLDEVLDAVTCASVFNSDKGRFITAADVADGYAEPFEDALLGPMRPLSMGSLYPPRRDVTRCTNNGCYDHADVSRFRSHSLDVMPELDTVSRATPPGERLTEWIFDIPRSWSNTEDYVLFIEVNVEGDYNDAFNPEVYPTPHSPTDKWDSWAEEFGYPYRGQPSVVYSMSFRLDSVRPVTMVNAVGHGALHGEHGDLTPITAIISDEPASAPGSGVDRLRSRGGVRATAAVSQLDPCSLADAPPECGDTCDNDSDCGDLLCDQVTQTCQAYCVSTPPVGAVSNLRVERFPNEQRAHMWAKLRFKLPASQRQIGSFEVRVRAEGGEWDQAFTHDREQELLPVALDVCADPDNPMRNRCREMRPGDEIEAVLANLRQSTRYDVEVIARDDECQELGAPALASFSTPERKFTTVSPCFIATAAYGSPLSAEIGSLRRLRDRYLAPHAAGRALIAAYYELGPRLAAEVRERDWLRAATRAILSPLVAVAAWLDGLDA